MNKILTAQEVTTEVLATLQAEAKKYMTALGCHIRSNVTVPAVRVLTFVEALKQARDEGITDSEESLKVRFDAIEACYSATDHTIYLKDTTVITESLLVHELVHSLQDEQTLIDACKDTTDQLRLDTFFEAEAYTIQGLFEEKALTTFLNKAKGMGITPYHLLQVNWNENGKAAILNIIDRESFNKDFQRRTAEIKQKQAETKARIAESKKRYEEVRKSIDDFTSSLDAQFAAIREGFNK